ncbi:Gfo/Idh/MocA family protein [Romboutsia sp. 1001713B170207_170306_H8]|uniref:Gfo/Idh/MocA family protein n=1 Tax=Romboutsia sp. 1001713B170207_170306_H8 TaxID=2787112 RepID=UPI00189AB2AF|nr:Gfo/Idh/MocA family oxidoreductase [Romboutsia sp. 1001713B170207_170306_H8]
MIKWGIIGLGAIANAFAKEINETENGKLVAVYGRTETKAKEFSNNYGIEKFYSNIDEFLNDNDIDAVYIATPHNYHMEYATKCINEKKHILCEKPFSYNKKTSKLVLDLAKENNVFIMEALWTLFLPAIKEAKRWIDEDKIGNIKMITANFGFKSKEDINSRLYNPNLAGGALLDVGIYTILLSNFMMSDIPKEINATSVMTRTNVDESDVISLRYENDALASLTCSIALETDNTAVIYGEKGKIIIPKFHMAKEAYLYSKNEELYFKDNYNKSGYKYEIIEVNDCIKNNKVESDIASHKVTLDLASLMDIVRSKIGLVYPFE